MSILVFASAIDCMPRADQTKLQALDYDVARAARMESEASCTTEAGPEFVFEGVFDQGILPRLTLLDASLPVKVFVAPYFDLAELKMGEYASSQLKLRESKVKKREAFPVWRVEIGNRLCTFSVSIDYFDRAIASELNVSLLHAATFLDGFIGHSYRDKWVVKELDTAEGLYACDRISCLTSPEFVNFVMPHFRLIMKAGHSLPLGTFDSDNTMPNGVFEDTEFIRAIVGEHSVELSGIDATKSVLRQLEQRLCDYKRTLSSLASYSAQIELSRRNPAAHIEHVYRKLDLEKVFSEYC